jgi:hypothetical protein
VDCQAASKKASYACFDQVENARVCWNEGRKKSRLLLALTTLTSTVLALQYGSELLSGTPFATGVCLHPVSARQLRPKQ